MQDSYLQTWIKCIQTISDLASLAAGLASGVAGSSSAAEVVSAINASKNAVENNAMAQWNAGDIMGLHPDTAKAYASIASADNMTNEEKLQSFEELTNGINMYDPAREYIEQWVKTPQYVALMMGGAYAEAAALVGMIESAVKNNGAPSIDDVGMIQLYNKLQVGSFISNVTNAGKGTTGNKPLDQAALEAQHGKGNVTQGGGNSLQNKENVTGNIANSQRGNASSNFGEHAAKDKAISIKDNGDRTLIYHENIGGHTIQKHVGKSDAELLKRFETEPRLAASSSFKDAYTADKAIGNAITENKAKLNSWLAGSDGRLILQGKSDFVVGNVIQKGSTTSTTSKNSVIVIDRDPLAPNGYRIHTAYPK